ncbi:MAG TPA: hypothetical protein VME66_10510 [Candidatus Acidoferrales bacterium]|nr:hypothetical protein [Candidatus Acidoferrales bacterium]
MDSTQQIYHTFGAIATPEQIRQGILLSRHALAWWAAQGVAGQLILCVVLFALIGVFFTFMLAFFRKMPLPERHAIAQEHVNEEIRRRQRAVRQVRY